MKYVSLSKAILSMNYSCSSYVVFLAALPLEMFLVTTLESGFAELDAVLQIVRAIRNIFEFGYSEIYSSRLCIES